MHEGNKELDFNKFDDLEVVKRDNAAICD